MTNNISTCYFRASDGKQYQARAWYDKDGDARNGRGYYAAVHIVKISAVDSFGYSIQQDLFNCDYQGYFLHGVTRKSQKADDVARAEFFDAVNRYFEERDIFATRASLQDLADETALKEKAAQNV